MISKSIKNYCCEDLSLIENYDKAINDETQVWHCHHRLEIELNKSREELKDLGLYYDRPASELIFLTNSDHLKLHGRPKCPLVITTYDDKGNPLILEYEGIQEASDDTGLSIGLIYDILKTPREFCKIEYKTDIKSV